MSSRPSSPCSRLAAGALRAALMATGPTQVDEYLAVFLTEADRSMDLGKSHAAIGGGQATLEGQPTMPEVHSTDKGDTVGRLALQHGSHLLSNVHSRPYSRGGLCNYR